MDHKQAWDPLTGGKEDKTSLKKRIQEMQRKVNEEVTIERGFGKLKRYANTQIQREKEKV